LPPYAHDVTKTVKFGFNSLDQMVIGDLWSQAGVDESFMYLFNANTPIPRINKTQNVAMVALEFSEGEKS
jgi:hypothetical protein